MRPLLVATVFLVGCSTLTQPPQTGGWVFRPGQSAETLARDTAICDELIVAALPGVRLHYEQTVTTTDVALGFLVSPILGVGLLDQKLTGPRVFDEQKARDDMLWSCLRHRGYRDARD